MVRQCMFSKTVGSVLLATLFLSGCSSDSSEQSSVQEASTQNDKAYSFNHSYDGVTTVGETETIKLNLTEKYETGVISVTVTGDDSLVFSSLSAKSFDLANVDSIEMDVDFTPELAGDHNLSVIVYVKGDAGEMEEESFDIAVNVASKS